MEPAHAKDGSARGKRNVSVEPTFSDKKRKKSGERLDCHSRRRLHWQWRRFCCTLTTIITTTTTTTKTTTTYDKRKTYWIHWKASFKKWLTRFSLDSTTDPIRTNASLGAQPVSNTSHVKPSQNNPAAFVAAPLSSSVTTGKAKAKLVVTPKSSSSSGTTSNAVDDHSEPETVQDGAKTSKKGPISSKDDGGGNGGSSSQAGEANTAARQLIQR